MGLKLSRTDWTPLVLIGAMALTAWLWNGWVGLSWKPLIFAVVLMPAILFSISTYYRVYRPEEGKLAEAILYSALWMLFPVFGTRLTYLAVSAGFPMQDQLFTAADAAIGFHWVDWSAYVAAHPVFRAVQLAAYQSYLLQPFLIVWALAWFGRRDGNAEFLCGVLIALIPTIFFVMFAPAWGPSYDVGISRPFDDVLLSIHTGIKEPLPYDGIICFPSFHTVMALLFAWAVRNSRMFPVFIVLNAVMILSTVAVGGHYLVDIFGGVAVAVICQFLAAKLMARQRTIAACQYIMVRGYPELPPARMT